MSVALEQRPANGMLEDFLLATRGEDAKVEYTPTTTLTAAHKEDVRKFLAAQSSTSFTSNWKSGITFDEISSASMSPRVQYILAHINDEARTIVGIAMLIHQVPSSAATMRSNGAQFAVAPDLGARLLLVVDDDFRRFGIGRKLFDQAKGALRTEDCGLISMEYSVSEKPAETLATLSRLGFAKLDRQLANPDNGVVVWRS